MVEAQKWQETLDRAVPNWQPLRTHLVPFALPGLSVPYKL